MGHPCDHFKFTPRYECQTVYKSKEQTEAMRMCPALFVYPILAIIFWRLLTTAHRVAYCRWTVLGQLTSFDRAIISVIIFVVIIYA